ncbi:hypothetical protein [Actinomadura xylanilytica]|uniref:hypothetical protein n=1 Tax=Actinomadura xylanilytica TaxID=887459 RepID=UPI00255B32EA|nr:hypothetical protein [Actinomadura xylanilytica]MDL4777519.1 hypothetical protein [Actinomadura xylanilytica]
MVSDIRVGFLEKLEHELDTRGLVARVVRTRSGPAFLRVVNPDAASLAEDVTCAPAPETHDHYYWWSWGERMHRVDDPGGAALKLARVLEPLRRERCERREARDPRDAWGSRETRDVRGARDGRDAHRFEARGLEPHGAAPTREWPPGHP